MVTINKYSKLYQSMAFLAAAVAWKGETRDALRHIHVEDGKMIATDGHRLHIVTPEGGCPVPDGNYTLIKQRGEWLIVPAGEEVNYPAWKTIYDACVGNTSRTKLAVPYANDSDSKTYGADYTAYALARAGCCVQHKYLQDLVEIKPWTVSIAQPTAPVLFENCTHTAIIMPMRVKE